FRYLRTFHNRTAGTFVPSGDLRDRLLALGVNNVAVLGRGVDCRLFTPERRSEALRSSWRASAEDPVALYVGRLAPEKIIPLEIEAYRAMRRVNAAVRFIVVGDGPERGALQAMQSDVIFCGAHTGEQLARLYASADIFLFPSETETFGNVTLEAMASGLAVVAYDYAAARAPIAHGATGVLAAYGDAAMFIEAAVGLARAPQSMASMRRQAREYAVGIDWEPAVKRFVALLTGSPAHCGTAARAAAVGVVP